MLDVPLPVVTEFCDVSLCCSDCEFVEPQPQSCSFSRKRAFCCINTQEEMRYERSQGKAKEIDTACTDACTSFEREQKSRDGRGWNARERTIIARTKQYLERSDKLKVRVEELEMWFSGES